MPETPRNVSTVRPRRRKAILGLAALLVLGVTGCGDGNVWVYVDNPSTDALTVTVDGKKEATIAAGKFAVVKCPPGKHQFKVETDRSLVYNGTRDLPASDKWGTTRKFVFNPDGQTRYVTYTVKYGSSPFEGLIESALQSQSDRAGAVRVAYAKLAKDVKLHPTGSWIDVSAAQYVLTAPPESVRSKSSTATRTALTRVGRENYNDLEAALGKSDPTERDLNALMRAIEKVLDEAP